MRDFTREMLEAPMVNRERDETAAGKVGFSLDRLFESKTAFLDEDVVDGLTFEELVGALLAARVEIAFLRAEFDFEEG